MKTSIKITLILFLLLGNSCAPMQYATTNFVEPIVQTYDVSGTKDELFLKSNLWMVSIFKEAKSVIQYSDKTEGILTGKYLLHYEAPYYSQYINSDGETIYALIEIRTKDGKVRISVTPDNWKYMTFDIYNRPVKGSQYNYNREMAINDIDALCKSFYQSLQSKNINF